ncbi:hypothetical protein [Desulfovulcanus sp.]
MDNYLQPNSKTRTFENYYRWATKKGIFEEEQEKQFDPFLIEIFFEIYDIIKAIRERFN